MNVAFFGSRITPEAVPYIQEMLDTLAQLNCVVLVHRDFYSATKESVRFTREPVVYSGQKDLEGVADFLFSVGGDGTILEAVRVVGDSGIPVAGVNLGRLGFLSGIQKEGIVQAIHAILNRQYQLESRTLLHLVSPDGLFGRHGYALNDLVVYKPNVMTLLTIRTWINNEFLNAYWADGLIVSTPTGSTAYSLSCTGPIVSPEAESLLITPVASHNLTVRPMIIRDDAEIRIRVEGKNTEFLVSLDSRTERVDNSAELIIRKAPFRINLLRLNDASFFQTIRGKLNWGLDNRNG